MRDTRISDAKVEGDESSPGEGGIPIWAWWGLGFALGLAVVVWAFLDPKLDQTLGLYQGRFGSSPDRDALVGNSGEFAGSWRSISFILVLSLAFLILLSLAIGLFRKGKQYRSLKALLMLVTLTCLWIGLVASLPNIAWYGKQARIGRLLDAFEPIAAELRDNWPTTDGLSPTLGPYKSYPISKPTTLMLMVSPELAEDGARLTQVDRTENGSLRFLLAGSELGDWVEWHPEGAQPESFHNSLQGDHVLSRSAAFGGGWFLVRYR